MLCGHILRSKSVGWIVHLTIIRGCQSSLKHWIFFLRLFCKSPDKLIRSPQLLPPQMPRAHFLKEYKAIANSHVKKAYICFCLDEQDSFEDEIDDHIAT